MAFQLGRYPNLDKSLKNVPTNHREFGVMAHNLDETAKVFVSWTFHFRKVEFVDPEIIAWAVRLADHTTNIRESLSAAANAARARNGGNLTMRLDQADRLLQSLREFTPVIHRKCKLYIQSPGAKNNSI